jgi:hypothetical protein
VGARRRAETGAASVVLQRDRRTFGTVGVVVAGVGANGLGSKAVRFAAANDYEGGDKQEVGDGANDGDDGECVRALGLFGVDVTGVQSEVSRGSCAGVKRQAAVGCAHGVDAGVDPGAHDSGGHGDVETRSRGSAVGGGGSSVGNSRVVAAGVDRVKVHVRDGSVLVFFLVVVERLPVTLEFSRKYCQSTFLQERVDDKSKLVSKQGRDDIFVLQTGVVRESEQRVSKSKTTHW